MRKKLAKLYPCLLVMATAFLAGCPGPYQWRHEHPLQGDALAVAAVTGRSVTLTDGRSFGLAGVSLEGMSPSQIENFENALRGLVAHPWPLPTKTDLNEQPSFPTKARLVPFPTSDGSAVMLIITDVYFHDLHLRRGIVLGFPFTPLVEDDYPIAFDLGERLLQQGLAYAAPRELPPNTSLAKSLPDDIYPQPDALAEHYASIVADARRLNLGIHHTDERALKLAALADDRDTVEALLEKNIDIDAVSDGETALIAVAARSYKPEMAIWLINRGADPDLVVENQSAMSAAVNRRFEWMIKPLLEHGADPSAVVDGRSLLAMASGGGPKYIELLLDHGAKPADANEAAMLMVRLASFGWPRGIGMILDQGFDPNVPTSNGVLPLHRAVSSAKPEVVKLLVERGADPAVVEPATRQTAIEVAQEQRDAGQRAELLHLLRAGR